MPEDNEKVEDFISLWRKKMENEGDKPSAIRDTLEKIQEIEKENKLLRNKIQDNIELISKTEQIIKSTMEENERLRTQLTQGSPGIGVNVSELQQKNTALNDTILELEKNLAIKEVELRARSNEKIELEAKLEAASKSVVSPPTIDSAATNAVIAELKSDLAKKEAQIGELQSKISGLTEENEGLNQQLIEVEKSKSLPIDYVVPVEQPKPAVIKPQSTQPSTETLERLCQDLQQDLNKYKRSIEQLTREKDDLKKALEDGGFQLEPEEFKELKIENEALKNDLSQLQESLKTQKQESPQLNEQLNNLRQQVKEKDFLIAELKSTQQTQLVVPKGPMSGLIEDLQNKINKLKTTIEEKNKIIEELQAS
jgi:chromosome segregation ATPase